jgi:hypothetical protein
VVSDVYQESICKLFSASSVAADDLSSMI